MRLPLAVLLLLTTTATRAAPQTETETTSELDETAQSVDGNVACNNSPDLCAQAYNAVTFMGAHNSAFLRTGEQAEQSIVGGLGGNQFFDAVAALDAGLRLLQAQVHVEDGQLVLCHTSCEISDAGPLSTWLGTVNDWMDQNANDVVTVMLVNSDDAAVSQFGAAFEASGVSKYAFTPRSTEATGDWPTLSEMITEGTRLVAFVASVEPDPVYPYLMAEFDYVFETAFEVTDSRLFNCTIERPTNLDVSDALAGNYLAMVNHFKSQAITAGAVVPDLEEIDRTNSDDAELTGSLAQHVQLCLGEWGVKPNFVLVDFWSEGPAVVVADEVNELATTTGRTDPEDEESAAWDTGASGGVVALGVLVAALMV